MSRERAVLCILVDAFRHDYLDQARTPALARLAEDARVARIRPILGYSDSIRASIFTGAYPDEHGYWMEYCYRPGAKAFAPLERLGALDRLPSDFVQRAIKFGLSQSLIRRNARRRGYRHLSLRHFPFRTLDRFDWTLRASMDAPGVFPVPTLFDRLTAANMPWRYLDSSTTRRRNLLDSAAHLPPETRFVFVYLHHIDMASHMFGIKSPLFDRVVRRTDSLVERVIENVSHALDTPTVLVFSDHGMSAVNRIVAYPELSRHPGFPDRFMFALDATMVRLWYEDDDPTLRDQVRRIVAGGARGRFLEAGELRDLHLSFDSRIYGDEIFLLEPGEAIFPNFHSMLKPKAMHAYHPDDSDQHGIFIGPRSYGSSGDIVELVEIAPLCLTLLGLEYPEFARGATG